MALQIANPTVVEKIEALARRTGLTKTSAVERAVDLMLSQTGQQDDAWDRFHAILAQIDRVPRLSEPAEPLEWDEHGMPR